MTQALSQLPASRLSVWEEGSFLCLQGARLPVIGVSVSFLFSCIFEGHTLHF